MINLSYRPLLDRLNDLRLRFDRWAEAILSRWLGSLLGRGAAIDQVPTPMAPSAPATALVPALDSYIECSQPAPAVPSSLSAVKVHLDRVRQEFALEHPDAIKAKALKGKWGPNLFWAAEFAAGCLDDYQIPWKQFEGLGYQGPQLREQANVVQTLEFTRKMLRELDREVTFTLGKQRAKLFKQTDGVMRLVQSLHDNPLIGIFVRNRLKAHLDKMRAGRDQRNKRISESKRAAKELKKLKAGNTSAK